MRIGSDECAKCLETPSYQLAECSHKICDYHYKTRPVTDTVHCAICHVSVSDSDIVKLKNKPTPPTATTSRTKFLLPQDSSSDETAPTPTTGSSSSMQKGNGPSQNGSGAYKNGYADVDTPTHVPAPRYVPPQMRAMADMPDPEVRPETSCSSTKTFATQPPMPQHFPPSQPAHAYGNSINGFTSPNGNYTYGTPQLVQGMNSMQMSHTDARKPIYDARRTGMASNVGKFTPGANGFASMTPARGMHGGFGMNAATSSFRPRTPNANGVAVANVGMHTLADKIKAGMSDDPANPDYGNPGRSNRLPPEPVNNNDYISPFKKGKVAPSNKLVNPFVIDNIKGAAAAFLGSAEVPLPAWFADALTGYQPTVEQVFEVLPLIDACRAAAPSTAGVLKITNIPYVSSRSEILAFLGRNANVNQQPLGSPYHAVHIMMDHLNGKTMDAFVEVANVKEATFVFNQFQRRAREGRHAKIGDRSVNVEMSSQGDFLAELFPRVKGVIWDGAMPKVEDQVNTYYQNVPSSGFAGFLLGEEINLLVKFCETPQRSVFAQRVLSRVYEHFITILHKYPWYAIDLVLLEERHALYDAVCRAIRALMGLLRKNPNNRQPDATKPTVTTLQELLAAVLTCPGFSEGMKAQIVLNMQQSGYGNLTTARGMNLRFGGNHGWAKDWPFHVLVKQPGASDQIVNYVADLLSYASSPPMASLTDLHMMQASNNANPQSAFGAVNPDYTNVNTVSDVERAELREIERQLSKILPRAAPLPPAQTIGNGFPS